MTVLERIRLITFGRKPVWTVVRLVALIAATIITYEFALLPIRVSGISMEPTFRDRSINLINRLAYVGGRKPQRGDVVAIKMAGPRAVLLKRVVGLPGEQISFRDGHVCVNGVRQEEPYLKYETHWRASPVLLGADEYYYVGDNRSMPIELHEHGYKSKDYILGKVLFGGGG